MRKAGFELGASAERNAGNVKLRWRVKYNREPRSLSSAKSRKRPGEVAGYLQFQGFALVTYELVTNVQHEITDLMAPYHGECSSWESYAPTNLGSRTRDREPESRSQPGATPESIWPGTASWRTSSAAEPPDSRRICSSRWICPHCTKSSAASPIWQAELSVRRPTRGAPWEDKDRRVMRSNRRGCQESGDDGLWCRECLD